MAGPRAEPARTRSLRPGRWFWAIAIGLSALCLAFFFLTGLAATPIGRLASDILGMAGAIGLVYGAARSLPTRERVEELMTLTTASRSDRIVETIRENFSKELSETARRNIRLEWRISIVGAFLLLVSFGISLSATLLDLL